MTEEKLETAVGMSRKWDAQEAGKEVARSAIEKLSKPPDFFLLFSTIHYKKHGGFEGFLKGVWDVLPEGTPLVGGTVAGFMNNYGCYTRGATALAMSYSKMNIATSIGHNTKKNPKKAAEECAINLLENLKNSKYHNNFIFQLTSGPTIPHFPGVGSSFIVKGKFKSSLASKLIETSTKKLQKGIGREEEVLESISKILDNSSIISGSSTDDMKLSENYQFINNNIYTNSVVAISISTDKNLCVNYKHGFSKHNNEILRISDMSFGGKIVRKINNTDAIKEFFRAINLSEDMFNEKLHRKTFFFPLGFEYNDNTLSPVAIGAVLGGGFSFSFKTESNDLYVLSATGESIVNAMNECIDTDAVMAFGISCCANLVTLGDNIFLVQEKIKKHHQDFLILFTMGEGVYLPSEKISKFFNETNVILSIK